MYDENVFSTAEALIVSHIVYEELCAKNNTIIIINNATALYLIKHYALRFYDQSLNTLAHVPNVATLDLAYFGAYKWQPKQMGWLFSKK